MTAWAGSPAPRGGQGHIRAADADRDHIAEILGTAYTEGRLSKDEYDARLDAALSARTYADLDQVVSDLPVPVPAPTPVVARTNGYAMASFACGIGQLLIGPFATIPAIMFGHMARNQIRRTGERGAGLALAGLVLGWGALILGIILMTVAMTVAARMQVPQTP
jgi:Domain of unknown function (DUF1707)/Domain of unknown function (DUF4190)